MENNLGKTVDRLVAAVERLERLLQSAGVRAEPLPLKSAAEVPKPSACLQCGDEKVEEFVRGVCRKCYASTVRQTNSADDPEEFQRRLVAAKLLLPAGKTGRKRKVNLVDLLAQAEADSAKTVRADTPALDEAMRNRDDAAVERELANEAMRDSATKTPRRKSRRK